jgi:hypothetical protein
MDMYLVQVVFVVMVITWTVIKIVKNVIILAMSALMGMIIRVLIVVGNTEIQYQINVFVELGIMTLVFQCVRQLFLIVANGVQIVQI